MDERDQLTCYRRPDGGVGVRNHVVALSTDAASNALTRAIARRVAGVVPAWLGPPSDRAEHSLAIGIGSNPNVAATIVVGSDPAAVAEIAGGIEERGKPVAGFTARSPVDVDAIASAGRVAARLTQDASALERELVPRSSLVLSVRGAEPRGLAQRVVEWLAEWHRAAGGTVVDRDPADRECAASTVGAGCVVDLRVPRPGEEAGHPVYPIMTVSDDDRYGQWADVDLTRSGSDSNGVEEAGSQALAELDATMEGRLTWGEALGRPEPELQAA